MLNIVAPIAGKSYFFDNEKDGFPKPFIEICGKTMLEHFVKNYENVKNKRFIFILKEEDVKRYHLDDVIIKAKLSFLKMKHKVWFVLF